MTLALYLLTGLIVLVTLAPFSRLPYWYLRIWDVPRLQILALIVLTLIGLLLVSPPFSGVLAALLVICAIWQVSHVYSYTGLRPVEISLLPESDPAPRVQSLALNVRQKNRDYARTLAFIKETDPDILLLAETDQGWADALAPVLAGYKTVKSDIRDDCYGMIFATRLEAETARIIHPDPEDHIPQLFATLRDSAGHRFGLLGLHPRPPMLGQHTDYRDSHMLRAAKLADRIPGQFVVIGDFNDVAWSRTARRFKRVGGFLDPRVGRGIYPTFHAQYPPMRYPIDHALVTQGIAVAGFDVGPNVGSDHFPLLLSFVPGHDRAHQLNKPAATLDRALEDEVRAAIERFGDAAGDLLDTAR